MIVHEYVNDEGRTVAICPMCASMADHGQGVLVRVLSVGGKAGECCGELHDGGGRLTPEEAAVARRRWLRYSGGRFNPLHVSQGVNRGLSDGIGAMVLRDEGAA